MVDVTGHLGMALLWLAPAWFVFDRPRTAATFVAASVWFGLLPDVDLYLSNWFAGIHHHGVFHTVLVVTLLAAVLGPLVGLVLRRAVGNSEWFSPDASREALRIGFAGVWVAGISHLFADILSAPDVSQPIEPLWPLYDGPVVLVDVVWYSATWVNLGLLAVGVAVNVALWYWKTD